jgi:hypothetical protein
VLLALARAQYLAGRIQPSFETCQRIAESARERGDARLLAEAALILDGVSDPGFAAGMVHTSPCARPPPTGYGRPL